MSKRTFATIIIRIAQAYGLVFLGFLLSQASLILFYCLIILVVGTGFTVLLMWAMANREDDRQEKAGLLMGEEERRKLASEPNN